MRLSIVLSTAVLSTAALVALSPHARADAGDDGDAITDIVVAATRVPTPVSQVASSVTLITAADIAAKQAQTLPDALKDVPGLNMVQTGGPGGQAYVFMRGANSNHVKVLVDGIDMGDPGNPNAAFDFGQFLTPDIERVEVLRGPQSGLYGSDAIGGVINIITKAGDGPARLTAGIEGGSFDTFNQNGGVSGATGPLHYAATIAHFRSGATPVTPLDLLAAGEKRNDDGYDNVTASAKLGYDVSDTVDLGLVGRYTKTDLRFTGDDFSTFPSHPAAQQSQNDTLQYYTRGTAHVSLLDGRLNQTLGVAYGSVKTSARSPDSGDTYYVGDRVKVDWQADYAVSAQHTLVVGAEHQRDAIHQPVAADTTLDGGYAELQSTLFENFHDTVSVRYDGNDRFGGTLTYRVAPTYLVAATGTRLKASVGSGFKAPSLSEMFQDYPAFGFFGNPKLKPESSTGYDLGVEQDMAAGRVQAGATWFHIDFTDLITQNASFTSYANIGKAHSQGVEGFVVVKPLETVTVRLDYTYTQAYDDVLNQELLRRPRHKGSVDVRWQATDRLSLDGDVVAVGSFIDGNRDFSIPRLKAPGYATVDLAANYDLSETVTVYGRVTNLLDKDYQNPTGFLRPGRGVFGGVRARI
ncbi:TonB-dependent receptor plug domain-containing protein [Nitrospirillum sp. BR 11828]|uniref:TonB-dependent receptor plug domain-containing protein n=1 Tax=Nitrospirillum sp. BR 11828 TaxID=3104325 RepID=UPI002ACA3C4E|nr:TonB-dependent receptor [Nitrospirillum sp. BR 11828]MDZ5650781.1 TonB-dependent receptor [Nitrospirillum sp. BR 11828]